MTEAAMTDDDGSPYLNRPMRTEEQARRGLQWESAQRARYGKWTIYYAPLSIPTRAYDWAFVHDDYDGAGQHAFDPPIDPRCGAAESVDACMDEIDAINAALREDDHG